jgi:hypothetical protein
MPSKNQALYDQLDIQREYTKRRYRKKEEFNSVRDNIRLEEDCSFMMDILEIPTAAFGYHLLLVVCDIASNEFDIEPMKSKHADTVLSAFKKMIARKHINLPKYYMITDQGNEFKGVFAKYLYDESIYHKQVPPGRHTQLANVDNLIGQLGRIIMGYLNRLEEKAGKTRRNWLPIIDTVREELNKIRKVDLPDDLKKDRSQALVETVEEVEVPIKKKGKPTGATKTVQQFKKSRYKEGQMVYVLLSEPEDIFGKKQAIKRFREGDKSISTQRHRIDQVVVMNGRGPTFRYILNGHPNVSYKASELRKNL